MRLSLSLIAAMSLFSFFAKADPLPVGAPAPDVTGINQDGQAVAFSSVYAKGVTLVYFYPKADTPGCTAEACSLRDSFADLHARNLQIIGVSRDKAGAQKKFQSKYNLPFTLIADTDGKIAEAFHVPSILGTFSSRQSFIIKDGKIAWSSLKAQTAGAAKEVQQELDNLK